MIFEYDGLDEEPKELPVPAWRQPAVDVEQEREEAFQRYLERSDAYVQAITDAGDSHWSDGDVEARRALYMRRFQNVGTPFTPPVGVKQNGRK